MTICSPPGLLLEDWCPYCTHPIRYVTTGYEPGFAGWIEQGTL